MLLLDLFERVLPRPDTPQPWNPKQVDPALLTVDEYFKIANPSGKDHPSSAYDATLETLNQSYSAKYAEYPHLLRRVRINGLFFEIRLQAEKRRMVKCTPDDEIVRDENGQPVIYTDEEVKALGLRPFNFIIAIFNEEKQRVASAQDEWGAMLIMVAREYRGFGLGTLLGKIARTYEPEKDSGGFTYNGSKNFIRVHREFVRDALTSGRYTQMIKSKQITMARVKEIVSSAQLDIKLPRPDLLDYNSHDPANWVLYAADGCYVLYDKKLKDLIFTEGQEMWRDKMIKGYLLVRIPQEHGLVVGFGGDSPQIKRFLLSCGSAFCASEGVPFAVDPEDIEFVDRKRIMVDEHPHYRSGMKRYDTRPIGPPLDTRGFAAQEERFRQTFDQYDEFKWEMVGMAEAKYRPDNS